MSEEQKVTLRCARCKKEGGVMDFVHLKVKLLCPKCFAKYSGWA